MTAQQNSTGRLIALENNAAQLWRCDDLYWHICFREGVNVSYEEMAEFLVLIAEYSPNKNPLIIERRYSYSATIEAYQLSKDCLSDCVNAIAYVAYTAAASTVSKYVSETYFENLPNTLLTSNSDAVDWFKTNNFI